LCGVPPKSSRLLKNAHLLGYPHPFLCAAQDRLIAAYFYVRLVGISGAGNLAVISGNELLVDIGSRGLFRYLPDSDRKCTKLRAWEAEKVVWAGTTLYADFGGVRTGGTDYKNTMGNHG